MVSVNLTYIVKLLICQVSVFNLTFGRPDFLELRVIVGDAGGCLKALFDEWELLW